jgi:ferredoxin--NADP+ reductase
MTPSRLRVAVVGAGPAGAFTVAKLRERGERFDIDVFERLPTPWGLLRAGVAPDHGTIKQLDETFERAVFDGGARFFGGVEVGRDITHADLAERYHAVVYAVGAQTDKSLGIPGEDLPGSLPATAFVGWYNGHPDFRDLAPDLSHPTAVVIGNGNVAADVTRVLTRSVDELARTDIADHALEVLRESRVERVVVLGRRGPAQAAFTNAELRELGRMAGVTVDVRADEVELDPVSKAWLDEQGTFTARRNVEQLRAFAAEPPNPGAPRAIELRFLRSPVAVHGDGRAEAVEIVRNELYRDGDGALRARSIDGTNETIEAGLVLRSVGYRGVPLPGVPFDERRWVLPNEQGRVLDVSTGARLPGVYTVGWIKRGPTGILGTNKRDAAETVASLVADWEAGELPEPRTTEDITEVLDGRPLVTAQGWRAIDERERAAGEGAGRPRVKLTTREELTDAAAAPAAA